MRSFFPLSLVVLALSPAVALAYGEPDEDGYPSAEERSMHFFTDRLRVDPDFTDSQFSNYEPVAPLAYNRDLNHAARFYADDMAENGCFPPDHSSCDGTSFATRLSGFYPGGPVGENIALGHPTPHAVVFDGWLYSDGHRENMLNPSWNELGTGVPTDDPDLIWVQDFGGAGFSGVPITTSGTHHPLWPAADETLNLFLAVHNPEGQPSDIVVLFDGRCYPMEEDRGTAGRQTYSLQLPSGGARCAPYFMKVTLIDGEEIFYPSTGALLAPVGGETCPDWTDQRPSTGGNSDDDSDCSSGEEAPGDGFGGGGQGCTAPSGGPESEAPENLEYGSCSRTQRGETAGLGLALLPMAMAFLRRRRRD